MSDDGRPTERVGFGRRYDVCNMAIDCTWRRICVLGVISDTDAVLTAKDSEDSPLGLPTVVANRSRQLHGNR